MVKTEKIKNIIKSGNLEGLNKYNSNTICNSCIEILEEEINNFSYDKDIDYLDTLIKILPIYGKKNQKELNEKFKKIHQQVKTFLVQKPGNIDKTNHNYKFLKNLINNIELIQISMLYDYVDKYDGPHYQIIDYIIFDLKKTSIFKDALQRFPYLVNYFDRNNKKIIVSVIDKYIEEVINYNKETGRDEILYYDEIINYILTSPKFIFDIIDKQTILKKIKQSLKEIKKDKKIKTFFLNILLEKVMDEEEEKSIEYYEYKYDIPSSFNIAIKTEVKKIINNYTIDKDRSIIDDYILSFDGEDAKEIDDALSVKILDNNHMQLGVHIADPMAVIDKDSIIFDEAAKRTTSIYLSDKTYSLFPEELMEKLISLNEGNYRPAISYYFEFDENGKFIKDEFIKSVIKVDRNMTYKDFNHILEKDGNDKLSETVKKLNTASNILQSYYKKDPLYEKVNRTTKNITNTNIIGRSKGERVVEATMIFTNHRVAIYFHNNGLPFSYRNHVIGSEQQEELNRIEQYILNEAYNEECIKFIEILKNIYPNAEYDIVSKGHFGLDINPYGHVTAPARREDDDLNIICLDKFYFDEYTEEDIIKYNNFLSKHVKRINAKRPSIEKFSSRYENLTR